ncbi:MAG TPA: alpha/beta fold hydrolase [Euzebyales bacterium]
MSVGEFARPAGVLRYVDRGTGPAVVCVHGNPTWSYYYRNLAQVLADDHRVIVPDHLGMGRSDVPSPRHYAYDLAARVDDFGALMDHLRVGTDAPATLVVHDWGGAIALTWATRHPDRVGRLVVTNTAAFPLLPGHRVPWLLWPSRVPVLGEALVCGANAFVRGTLRLGVRRRHLPPAVRRAYREPYGTWHDRIGILRFVRDVPEGPGGRTHPLLVETAANLHRLADRPAQIVWGLRDPVLTAPYLDAWRRTLPDAEVHALDDAGHLVLEDAAEAVPLIAAFLARTASAVTHP